MPGFSGKSRTKFFMLLLIFFIIGEFKIQAQVAQPDSVRLQTNPASPQKNLLSFLTKNQPARGAPLRSLVFPGWGQWFNQRKDKAAGIFTFEIGMLSAALWHDHRINELLGAHHSNSYIWQTQNYHRVCRNQFSYLLAGSVLYSMLDAYNDATIADTSQKANTKKIAVFRSLLLPGGGYAYTGKKIKSLLTFATGAGLTGAALWHNYQAYLPKSQLHTATEIDHNRDYHLSRRNSYLLGYAGLILFSSVDSYVDASLTNFPKEQRSPKAAVIRSALIPGWGQWYNNKKFKALVVFGTEIGFVSAAVWHNQRYVERLDSTYSVELKKVYYDFHLNWRNRYVWYLAGAVLYSMADAYVDAHLFDFDEAPELSLNIQNGFGNNFSDFALTLTLSKTF